MPDETALRELRGIFGSNRAVGQMINASPGSIQAWLAGRRRPQPYFCVAAERALECVRILDSKLSTAEIQVWFVSPNRRLRGHTPASRMRYAAEGTQIRIAATETGRDPLVIRKLREAAAASRELDLI